MVAIFKTTYGYYRYWVKNILADGGVIKYRFIKNPDSYAGVISVNLYSLLKSLVYSNILIISLYVSLYTGSS